MDEPVFKFEMRSTLAMVMWACIQKAPFSREATNELAELVHAAIEAQNKAFAAEAAAKMNGKDETATH